MESLAESIRLRPVSAPVHIISNSIDNADLEPSFRTINKVYSRSFENIRPRNSNVFIVGQHSEREQVDNEGLNRHDETVENFDDENTFFSNIGNVDFLKDYFRILYIVGSCPHILSSDFRPSTTQKVVNKIAFVIVNLLSLINGFKYLKGRTVWFLHAGGLHYFAKALLYLFEFLGKVYLTYTFLLNKSTFGIMIDCVTRFNSKRRHDKAICVGFTLLVAISMLVIVFQTGTTYLPLRDWSFSNLISIHAFKNRLFMETWSAYNFTNITDALFQNYYFDEDGTYFYSRVTNAIAGMILEFGGSLQDVVYEDTMLMCSLTAYVLMKYFADNLPDVKNLPGNHLQVFNTQLNRYEKLRSVFKCINEALGGLLILFHFNNTFLCVDFLLEILENRSLRFDQILNTIRIIKACLSYVLAARASQKNDVFRDWLYGLHRQADNLHLSVKISMAIDEVKSNPVGIGQNVFHVQRVFVYHVLGLIFHYFVFLARAPKGDDTTKER